MQQPIKQAISGTCGKVWHWIMFTLTWFGLIFLIVAHVIPNKDLQLASYIIFGTLYTGYLIDAFLSHTCRYLCNITHNSDIYTYMQALFFTPAYLVMHVQCYHYETRYITERDSQGNTHTRTEQVRVNTHSAYEYFTYKSWRDISGQFVLDTQESMQNTKKAFVKLRLEKSLIMAADGTTSDYEQQREIFKRLNFLDTHQDYWETTELQGYQEFQLIRVTEYSPSFFGIFWYILAVFLMLEQFYKLYVAKYCSEQGFNVKKVISSRVDLNLADAGGEYQALVPTIVYMGQPRVYSNFTAIPVFPAAVAHPPQPVQGNMPYGTPIPQPGQPMYPAQGAQVPPPQYYAPNTAQPQYQPVPQPMQGGNPMPQDGYQPAQPLMPH